MPWPAVMSKCPRSPPRGPSGGGLPRPGTPSAVDPSSVLQILPLEPLVCPEDDVLRHVGREAARGRAATERFREAPDVVRARAAAHTEVAHAERVGRRPRLGDLVAVAQERDRGPPETDGRRG